MTTNDSTIRLLEANAVEEPLPQDYDELRWLAAGKKAKEAAGHTLEPTALVNAMMN